MSAITVWKSCYAAGPTGLDRQMLLAVLQLSQGSVHMFAAEVTHETSGCSPQRTPFEHHRSIGKLICTYTCSVSFRDVSILGGMKLQICLV